MIYQIPEHRELHAKQEAALAQFLGKRVQGKEPMSYMPNKPEDVAALIEIQSRNASYTRKTNDNVEMQ